MVGKGRYLLLKRLELQLPSSIQCIVKKPHPHHPPTKKRKCLVSIWVRVVLKARQLDIF